MDVKTILIVVAIGSGIFAGKSIFHGVKKAAVATEHGVKKVASTTEHSVVRVVKKF